MKTIHINLLIDRRDYYKAEKFFRRFRRIIVGYSLIFVTLVLVLFFITYKQNEKIQSLIDQKGTLFTSLQNQNNQEAKLVYVEKKLKSYNQFVRNDANFLPYYNLLVNSLNSTASASLSSFTIDNTRKTAFSISFVNIDSLLQSFDYLESNSFLKYFASLSLDNFGTEGKNNSAIKLSFIGQFNPINENQN